MLKINKPSFLLMIASIYSLLSDAAIAAHYQVDKVQIYLSKQHPIDTLKLSNPDNDGTITNLQITEFKWTQQKGEDILVPSKDLIIAPPFARLASHKSQLVRIGWRTPAVVASELTYRMLIADISPIKKIPGSIQFKVQSSIPIFISPPTPVPATTYQIKRAGNNQLKIIVANTGNVHIKINDLTLTNANNRVIAFDKTPFYVLAQQNKEDLLTVKEAPGSHVIFTANTDRGQISLDLPVT